MSRISGLKGPTQRLAMGVAAGLTAQLLCAAWSWLRAPAAPTNATQPSGEGK